MCVLLFGSRGESTNVYSSSTRCNQQQLRQWLGLSSDHVLILNHVRTPSIHFSFCRKCAVLLQFPTFLGGATPTAAGWSRVRINPCLVIGQIMDQVSTGVPLCCL